MTPPPMHTKITEIDIALSDMGQSIEALSLHMRALLTREVAFGKDQHHSTADTYKA